MAKAAGLIAIFLFCTVSTVYAESAALLLLDNLQHHLGLEYTYDGRKTDIKKGGTTRYTRHRFEEIYGFGIQYAIVDPNLLYGRLSFETALNQDKLNTSGIARDSTSFGTGSSLRHDVNGTLFHRRPISVNFYTRMDSDRVSRELVESYEVEMFSQGLRVDMKNLYLPAYMDVSRVELSTDGLTRDYLRTNKNFSLGISNRYNISDSNLSFNFFDNSTEYTGRETTKVESGRLYASNKLSWHSAGKARSLFTTVNYREENGTTGAGTQTDNEAIYFTEMLGWQFGRALDGGAEFSQVVQQVTDRTRRDKYGRAFLKHRFVQSLTTQIDVNARETTYASNEETQIFGKINLAYVKRLSADDFLNVQFAEIHGVIDRKTQGLAIPIIDEAHTATLLGQIVLLNPEVEAESIVVRHADPALRLLPYSPGLDYQIDQIGQLTVISILPGSEILPDTALLITYSYRNQGDLKYAEVSRFLAGSLDLDEHTWRLYGNWSKTDRDRISGDSSLASLRDSRQMTLGIEHRQPNTTYGLEYLYFDSDYEIRRSLRASFSYWRIVAGGVATFGLQDTWSHIEASDSDGLVIADRNQNSFNVSSSWRKSIYGRGLLLLKGNYFNTRGDVLKRDELKFGADYQVTYGRFSLAFESDLRWQILDEQTIREEYLRVKLRRYF